MSASIATRRAPIGATGIEVSALCVGTAAWGVTSVDHGVEVPERQAIDAARHVFAGPLNLLDTSNNYGAGEAERRIGLAIAEHGGLPPGFVLQTKLDRDPVTGEFTVDRLRHSLDESLERLGLDRVPVLYLHDPEHIGFDAAMATGGAVDTTVALRDEGLTGVIGVGGAPASMMRKFVDTGIFDVILTHNRFTLVDRTADDLISAAHERGIAVMNAAVYAGGVLARYPRTTDLYGYGPGDPALLARIDAMGDACHQAGVPLMAAALQHSTRDPRITSTVCGVESALQVDEAIALADLPIPEELWSQLDSLAPPAEFWRND